MDEAFESGAIHSFLISYEPSRPGGAGDPYKRSRKHFERAVSLSKGALASPFVAFAESVSEKTQDRGEFESLLQGAIEVDANANPEWRLENLLMQRRARWLLSRADSHVVPLP